MLALIVFLLAGLFSIGPAVAETRIFLIDASDGYGVNQCLATRQPCGQTAAGSLCRAREYQEALDYGRLDQSDVTGLIPETVSFKSCAGRTCPDLIAIACSR